MSKGVGLLKSVISGEQGGAANYDLADETFGHFVPVR